MGRTLNRLRRAFAKNAVRGRRHVTRRNDISLRRSPSVHSPAYGDRRRSAISVGSRQIGSWQLIADRRERRSRNPAA